ncbi:MAG: PAS domain S-box protein [Planctomycetota bacterium]|nr:PAS domain S-box protein [Planctomycetota bacterium]
MRGEASAHHEINTRGRAPHELLPGWVEDQVLRRFRDVTQDIAVVIDLDARIVWANRAAQRLFGIDSDLRPHRTILDSVAPEDRILVSAALARIRAHPQTEAERCEVSHVGDGGSVRRAQWFLHSICGPHGTHVGYSGCGHDVTEQRRAESAILRSDARMSAVLSSLLDPMVSIDAYGTILSASNSVERVFGYAPSELIGQNVKVLMPDPHRTLHDEYLARYRSTNVAGIIGRTREFDVLCKDGRSIVCALSVSRADPSDGQDAIFTGTFRDVTDLKRATQALVESERRFHAIFDGAFQLIGMLSPTGHVLEMNPTALDLIGAHRDEVIGAPFAESRWWSHSPEMQARVRAAVESARRGEFVRFEARSVAHDGSVRDIDFSLKPVKDESGRVVLLIPEGRDISELKRAQRAETAMLRAFAAIGESAALLAHEIKNPITAVNVALRAVATELGEDHRVILEDLVTRMQRVEQMMRRTLSFTKPLDLRSSPCTARELFASVREHLQSDIARYEADLRVEIPAEDVSFACDHQLLRDVLANLVTNALEAKGRGALVTLSASRCVDGSVVLAVEDDGPGIPESMIDSLFRPFVTTKSKGNGLGLAICRKVVEEHGGTITAERGRTRGARFEIRLPLERTVS